MQQHPTKNGNEVLECSHIIQRDSCRLFLGACHVADLFSLSQRCHCNGVTQDGDASSPFLALLLTAHLSTHFCCESDTCNATDKGKIQSEKEFVKPVVTKVVCMTIMIIKVICRQSKKTAFGGVFIELIIEF